MKTPLVFGKAKIEAGVIISDKYDYLFNSFEKQVVGNSIVKKDSHMFGRFDNSKKELEGTLTLSFSFVHNAEENDKQKLLDSIKLDFEMVGGTQYTHESKQGVECCSAYVIY